MARLGETDAEVRPLVQGIQRGLTRLGYDPGTADEDEAFTELLPTGHKFHGLMDDVKVNNVARTSTQIAQAVADATGEPVCSVYDRWSDFSDDCKVNFIDFAEFASQWLSPWTMENLADFAEDWLVDDRVNP